MSSAAEVLVKLVVDSNAPKATADLKRGLEKAESSQKHLTKGLLDGKANLASLATIGVAGYAALAAAAAAGGAAVIGLAIGATHAFLESEQQVRALAGTLTLLDTSGTGFEAMTNISRNLKDELEQTAMQVGATDDALMAAFTDVIERGGKSIDQAQELTEAMANAGRAVPGGIGTLSGAFEMIEMGAVRAKNPIVGMIAATHLLKGNAKQVAKQMQAMAPEEQMKLAEKAIANMSKKMKDVPLSIQEMSTSMKVFVGNLFEDAGRPIVENLMPIFTTIRKFAFDNQDVFKSVAKEFGGMVGKVVEVALPVSQEIMSAVKSSSGEIKKAIEAFAGPGRDAFKYIYENKEAFAKTMGDVFTGMVKATRFLAETMSKVSVGFMDVVKLAAKLTPGGAKFMAEEEQASMLKELHSGIAATGANPADYESRKQAYIDKSGEIDDTQLSTAGAAFDKARSRAMSDHMEAQKQIGIAEQALLVGDTAAYVAAFDKSVEMHDASTSAGVADLLKNYESMAQALRIKGPEIFKTGSQGFIDALGTTGAGRTADMAAMLTKGWGEQKKGAPDVGKGPVMNQYIGTVNIKQDFKDIDPERVAIVFRNDLAKHGAARIQARGAQGGGF